MFIFLTWYNFEMITEELVSFIKGEIAKGKSRDQIRSELTAGGGWSSSDVEEGFKSIDSPVPVSPAAVPGVKSSLGFSILKIFGGAALGFISGSFFSGSLFNFIAKFFDFNLGGEIASPVSNILLYGINVLSYSSFGIFIILMILIFYRRKVRLSILKILAIVAGSALSFMAAVVLAIALDNEAFENLFNPGFLSMGIAGIVGGGMMFLILQIVLKIKIKTYIFITLLSGVIGAFLGSNVLGAPGILVLVWQTVMMAIISYLILTSNKKEGTYSISTVEEGHRSMSSKKKLVALGFCFFLALMVFVFFILSGNDVTSRAHSLSVIPENEYELPRLLTNRSDANISGEVRKSSNGRFWDLTVAWDGCWESCTDRYIVDTQKKNFYKIKGKVSMSPVVDNYFFVTFDSSTDASVLDASKNKVIDTIKKAGDIRILSFGHGDYYAYTEGIVMPEVNFIKPLIVRDIKSHTSLKLGNLYYASTDAMYGRADTTVFSEDGSLLYAVMYTGEEISVDPISSPVDNNLLEFVEFNLATGERRVLSDQEKEGIFQGLVLVPAYLNNSLSFFNWRFEQGALNPDGIFGTKIFLDATYENGRVLSKQVDEVGSSCNKVLVLEEDKDALKGVAKIQCYGAGLGYWFKVVEKSDSYEIVRKTFEEALPTPTLPPSQYETVVTFPLTY